MQANFLHLQMFKNQELRMTLIVTFAVLTVGLLYSVSARPIISYKEDADKQVYKILPYFLQERDANEQGSRFTFPQEQSNSADNQGRVSFDWAKQQYLPYYFNSPSAKKEGFHITYPFEQQRSANEEGIKVKLPQEQSYYRFGWPLKEQMNAKQQRLVYTFPQEKQSGEKQQAFSYHWPQQQGFRVPFGKEQGVSINWPTNRQYMNAKEEGFRFIIPQKQGSTAEEQGIGVSFGWPQAQGISIPYPYGYEQGYNFNYPKEQGFVTQARNFARVLCNAAYGNGKVAEVAAYAQMDVKSVQKLMDTMKKFGKNMCDLITGNGGTEQEADKDMSDELTELLADEK